METQKLLNALWNMRLDGTALIVHSHICEREPTIWEAIWDLLHLRRPSNRIETVRQRYRPIGMDW